MSSEGNVLIEKIYALKEKRIRHAPCHTNRASEAGHPCERYLVLRRTHWQDAALHSLKVQLLFDEGNLQEQAVLRDLHEAGWIIVEAQRDYEWKRFELTAHIDGKVILDQYEAAPFEIKSMSPSIWDKIVTLDDLLKAAQPWLQKYPAQMQLYLLLSNAPRGFMILKNKATGELKEIEVQLDYEYAERLLKKLERINAHVAAGTIPPPIPYEEKVCDRCPFYEGVCQPDVVRTAAQLSEDAELAKNLARHALLKPLASEYKALDESIKKTLKGLARVVCGEFLIVGREMPRKAYTVTYPDSSLWKTTIKSLKANPPLDEPQGDTDEH